MQANLHIRLDWREIPQLTPLAAFSPDYVRLRHPPALSGESASARVGLSNPIPQSTDQPATS